MVTYRWLKTMVHGIARRWADPQLRADNDTLQAELQFAESTIRGLRIGLAGVSRSLNDERQGRRADWAAAAKTLDSVKRVNLARAAELDERLGAETERANDMDRRASEEAGRAARLAADRDELASALGIARRELLGLTDRISELEKAEPGTLLLQVKEKTAIITRLEAQAARDRRTIEDTEAALAHERACSVRLGKAKAALAREVETLRRCLEIDPIPTAGLT